MNLSYSLILAFVGIAGPTSAEPTSIFMPFENDLDTVRTEVVKYCDDPTEYDKSSLYGPIKDWDVSALTTMAGLFSEDTHISICHSCKSCNPPVSNWNVSAVENFSQMFHGAAEFNQDLSKWVVGKGLSFSYMFHWAVKFNQDLSGWDVRKGYNFSYMFYGAVTFNQDLSKWGVGKGLSFELMFKLSGMNHYIGGWDMAALDEDQLSVITSMLVLDPDVYNEVCIPSVEWHQLSNLITPVNKEFN